jgi:hypothetical protein
MQALAASREVSRNPFVRAGFRRDVLTQRQTRFPKGSPPTPRAILPAMAAPPAEDMRVTGAPSLGDLVGWVRDGERLFGAVLQTLQQYELLREQAGRLEQENRQLRGEMQLIREELHQLRSERVEAAATLKAFAEHVTQLATLAIQHLGKGAG